MKPPPNPTQNWKGWPVDTRKPDWIDQHFGLLFGLLITAGSIFSFICGVVVGVIQPPLYRLIISMLGIGE